MDIAEQIQAQLRHVSKHMEILHATGDASQSLLRPEEEEVEDKKRVEADPTLATQKTRLFETPLPSEWKTPTPTPALPRQDDHLFQLFLDGSVHARALGTGLEGQRSFPLGLFQIGAAVVLRNDDGHLFPHSLEHRVLLTIPSGAEGLSDTAWTLLAAGNPQSGHCHIVKISRQQQGRQGSRDEADDMRLNASATAYSHMHTLEIDMCERALTSLGPDKRILIDGSVQFGRFLNNPAIVGIAKHFWHMPALNLEGRRRTRLNLLELLAHLPVAHRTAVFEAHGGDVGFWYVRLRPGPHHPLEGVVKIELPRLQHDVPVSADEATHLSRAIVAERTATAFSLDKRWASLLYPIHYAERLIKTGFLSEQRLDRIVHSGIYKALF